MVFRVPSYYKNFRCIADKCPDNCCRGWEIDIDEDTLDYYKDLKGPMAEKIRASISEDGSFVLNEEGWCPLLTMMNMSGKMAMMSLQKNSNQ